MAEKLNSVSDMIDSAVGKSRRLKEGILKAEWEKIVGKICNECQPDYIRDGILYISVKSTFFIHHLTMEKSKYIQKINEYFGESVVTDISIRTGKLNEKREEYLARESEEESEEKQETHIKKEEVLADLENSNVEKRNLGILEK